VSEGEIDEYRNNYVLAGEVGGFQIYRREGCDVPTENAGAY